MARSLLTIHSASRPRLAGLPSRLRGYCCKVVGDLLDLVVAGLPMETAWTRTLNSRESGPGWWPGRGRKAVRSVNGLQGRARGRHGRAGPSQPRETDDVCFGRGQRQAARRRRGHRWRWVGLLERRGHRCHSIRGPRHRDIARPGSFHGTDGVGQSGGSVSGSVVAEPQHVVLGASPTRSPRTGPRSARRMRPRSRC